MPPSSTSNMWYYPVLILALLFLYFMIWLNADKHASCIMCAHVCVCVECLCVDVCASCQGLQEMILQGAVLSHTCSMSFIVLSLFRHLICRDATEHTYLIWLLQGKASWSIWWNHLHGNQIRRVLLYSQLSQTQPMINNLHFLPNDYHSEHRNRPCREIRLKILVRCLASANYLCFVMIQINCCYFQNLNMVQDNGWLLGKGTKRSPQLKMIKSVRRSAPVIMHLNSIIYGCHLWGFELMPSHFWNS